MKKIKFLLLAAVAVMMSATSFAADADFPARPDTAIFVHDFAGMLKADQVKAMDDSLRAFSKRTTNQIMVITVKDLGDYDPKMYAAELGDRWGVGQKKLDNGMIILIKPKTNDSKGQFALCPGRGLNGALPDVTCKRIVDGKAIPELKKGDYDAAVWAVLKTVMPICAGEISAEDAMKKKSSGGDGNGWMWFVGIFGAIVGGVAYSNNRAKKKQALLEATETPEERAARLAAAEQRKKELEEERKKREAERAIAGAAAAAKGVFKSAREKQEEEERRKRANAEKFGGGTFDGGGASSEW